VEEVRDFLAQHSSFEPTAEQQEVFNKAVVQVKSDEMVIKWWILFSINRRDFENHRIFMVTTKAYYRVKCDFKKQTVAHCKRYPVMNVNQIHCGKFKNQSGAIPSKMKDLIEKDAYERQWGIQIWIVDPTEWKPPSVSTLHPFSMYRPSGTPEEQEKVCAEICLAMEASIHWYRNGSAPIDYLHEFAAEAPKRFDGHPVFPARKVDNIPRSASNFGGVFAAAHNKWFVKQV